jgi:hypothetical protein
LPAILGTVSSRGAWHMEGFHEGQKVWVAQSDGSQRDPPRHPRGVVGIVALVSADDSAALVEALHERAVRLTHHRLSDTEAAALQAAVVQAPLATTPDM